VTFAELEAELAAGRLRPAYLLAGEEALLRDDALCALRRFVLSGSALPDFNFDRIEIAQTTAGALRDAVLALPVLAERRLVWLIDTGARGAEVGKLLDALPELLCALAENATAVLVVSSERVDRRERWVKAFAEPAVVLECEAPRKARELVTFIQNEARRQAVELGPGAAELLAERVGPALLVLRQELAKVALLAGPCARVTRAHVAAAACDLAEEPIWDLTDAIGEGRMAEALAVLLRLLAQGAAAPAVLGALASHLRKLLRVRAGAPPPLPTFVLRKLEGQARRYSEARLQTSLRAVGDADLALKGLGQLPPVTALEHLVIGLAG